MTGPPLLAATGLRRRYRVRAGLLAHAERVALDGADLALHEGRHLGVVGASGSGKSTLVRLLLGLEAPDAGEVRLHGGPLGADVGRLRRELAAVAQDPRGSLDPRLGVADSIREPLECLAVPGDHGARVAELLTAVGLDPADGRRRPGTFSGGECQRIAIARALAARPRVLLADEPFGAVDAATRVALVALVRRLTAADGLTLLLVSHDLGLVERLCDDVVVLDAGATVESGPVAEVFAAPRSTATRRLLDAVPRLPTTERSC